MMLEAKQLKLAYCVTNVLLPEAGPLGRHSEVWQCPQFCKAQASASPPGYPQLWKSSAFLRGLQWKGNVKQLRNAAVGASKYDILAHCLTLGKPAETFALRKSATHRNCTRFAPRTWTLFYNSIGHYIKLCTLRWVTKWLILFQSVNLLPYWRNCVL